MRECSVMREVELKAGSLRDFRALARWHYRRRLPAAVTRVLVAWHRGRRVGVLVEAPPLLACRARDRATRGRFRRRDRRAAARALNREVRAILRVVVHPNYRGIGLGVRLVRAALASAGTPYVEAIAQLGTVHPLFVRAGMKRGRGEGTAYFWWRRRKGS